MTERSSDDLLVVLVGIAALVVLPLVFMAFGMVGIGMMDGAWGMHGTGGGWVFLPALASLALLFGGGYLVYRLLAADDTDRALEELRLAYARGDLTREEYEDRRDDLK
ncbi:SHOCT domain-containing protein [Salarchaeum japonicum]|uniref:SHOCT domain-containing protein n=1 Tax=Salarchaeum japonicum TaxID=555573 RepID=A0AAV3T3Z3_9EURY|nr:SHOCT domain-containing protein [Salarchaeum japonicum]